MRRVSWGVLAGLLVAGVISGFWCAVARADEKVLRPYWTGPVWGAFTDAGPDSVEGAKAEISVPIGVRVTDPFTVFGQEVTVRVKFRWNTKAFLGADSEPASDPSYEWFPVVRVEPDTANGFFRYFEGGPYHKSNFDDGADSRSMNAVNTEWAFAWEWSGIAFDAYVNAWFTYDYGENTDPLSETITLFDDFGAKVLVRGSVDMIQLATELGPDWQKLLMYVPLMDFYKFGLYGELHHGEGNSFLDPNQSATVGKVGITLEPPRL